MIAALHIDLAAIRANAAALARLIAPARLAAVIKADAYGHGLVPVARALDGHVARFCVYEAAEALALRESGVRASIHILGPVAPNDLAAVHAAKVEITLWDTGGYARDVAAVAQRAGSPFAVQVKIETGITRLGIPFAQTGAAIAGYLASPGLRVAGMFSHLAAAEELDSDFTLIQLARFGEALAPVYDTLVAAYPGALRHIAASAAAMLWPETRLDLVRAGIALYGLWPSPETRARFKGELRLQPALRWTTQLVAVRDVAAETSVGYGRTYRTHDNARIGVLPIGYAEGVPRQASNRGSVLILGKACPIVGRVCMNMAMVDVTNVPEAVPGTRVTLVGTDGNASLTTDDWARWADSINYDIVARFPKSIPRVYSGA